MKIAYASVTLCAVVSLTACKASPEHELVSAAMYGDMPEVQASLAAKVNVNARDRGETALIMASMFCQTDVVKVLIAASADVNERSVDHQRKSFDQESALIAAAGADKGGCPEAVKDLIKAGADVNARSGDGTTALTTAANEGELEIAQSLISAGADVNEAPNGDTPLYFTTGDGPPAASRVGRAAIAQLLRAHGAHI